MIQSRWCQFVLAVTLLCCSPVNSADTGSGVKPMRPDSLAGWDYGERPMRGWTIRDGRLAGSGTSTPLLSGYTTPLDKHAAMAIYGNVPPLARADRSGQWNRVVIQAEGRMVSGWMNGELVHLEGSGRWVGLIFDQPADVAMGIASLTIDGQPTMGWASPDLATFLGQAKGDFRACLSGRHGTLAWRYLMLEPVDFQESLVLKTTAKRLGPRLAVFYTRP